MQSIMKKSENAPGIVAKIAKALAASAVVLAVTVFAFGTARADHHRGGYHHYHHEVHRYYGGPDYYYAPPPDYYAAPEPYEYYGEPYPAAPPSGITLFFGR